MNANQVLIDLLEDNRRRVKRFLSGIHDDCLFWQPGADANSIAITLWHMARMFDVFLTLHALGQAAQAECWFQGGWASQTGYDPRGIGMQGWGMLTGYTQAEVAALPQLTREQLLGYLDQVYDAVNAYLSVTPEETLLLPAPGFDGKYSHYQCLQMPLMDNVRHLGECYAIKSCWERRVQA